MLLPNFPFAKAVHVSLGLLLLLTAGLKLYGLNVALFATSSSFASSSVQVMAVLWEIILGLWLISCAYRAAAWLAAVCTFLAFTTVSGYLAFVGEASCGCFGVIQASPWWALGVDVAALILLSLSQPNWRAVKAAPMLIPTGFSGIFLGAGVILVLLIALAILVYGSPVAALARLRGTPLYTPGYVDFGTARPGDVVVKDVMFSNLTGDPIRLIGGTSDCSCIATSEIPLTISAGKARPVKVFLYVPKTASGVFTRRAEFFTDYDQQTIRFSIGCRIK